MEIEVRKINELKGFEPCEFSISPNYWNVVCLEKKNLEEYIFEEAKEKAKEIEGICVVIIHEDDGFGSYVLGEPTEVRGVRRFLLFNAVECKEEDNKGKIQVVVYNGTQCCYQKKIEYSKGSVL